MTADDRGFDPSLTLSLRSDPFEIRATLGKVTGWLAGVSGCAGVVGAVEMTLAEVLNNIAEHAYGGKSNGAIHVRLDVDTAHLRVKTCDCGAPMPDGRVPSGAYCAPEPDCPDLPEGGFGWFLIHSQCSQINYRRDEDQNHLLLEIPLHGA